LGKKDDKEEHKNRDTNDSSQSHKSQPFYLLHHDDVRLQKGNNQHNEYLGGVEVVEVLATHGQNIYEDVPDCGLEDDELNDT